MSLFKKIGKGIRYIENFRDARKILKENNGYMVQSSTGTMLLAIPLYSRKELNDMKIIEDKKIEYKRKEILDYGIALSLGLDKEYCKPLELKVTIIGPAENKRKYSDLRKKIKKEASEIYENKIKELGNEGKGKILEITYNTSDFDLIDKTFFSNLTEKLEINLGNMPRMLSLFYWNDVFCYVSEIGTSADFIEKLDKNILKINELKKKN